MTKGQFKQMVKENLESPLGQYVIVAKQVVAEKTKDGIIISDSMKAELAKKQDLLTVIATNENSVVSPGDIIRAGRVLTQSTPLTCNVEGYELAVVMNHDIITKQKGFSNVE
jgi:co-chaperonin GroES (HSP10)